ncbi:MAG: protein translocase subunit SecD [Actinomycetia bacterium]|nr:protein translocase subunit SecD [Actinomycetes bacterium]
MARNSAQNFAPLRKLIAFAVVIVLLYGLMAVTRSWAPQLGLDLRGGTTVTLTARTTDVTANAPNGPLTTDTNPPSPSPTPGATDTATPSGSATPTTSPNPTDTAGATPTISGAPSVEPGDTATPGATTPGPNGGGKSNWTMADAMQQAQQIIQERVDSMGVGEAQVTIQNNNQIQVAAPNVAGDQLVSLVGRTAQLGFRNVYAIDAAAQPAPATPTTTPTESPTPSSSSSPTPAASSAKQRPVPALPTAPPAPRPSSPTTDPNAQGLLYTLMNWQPSAKDQTDFGTWQCGQPFPDVWDQPLFACSTDGNNADGSPKYVAKYLLGPVIISGQHVNNAQAGIPQGQLAWEVDLTFDAVGTAQFAAATTHLYNNYLSSSGASNPTNQFAIVLDGQVISAPGVSEGAITTGSAKISGGGINQDSAQNLARVLRYGALPLTFDVGNVDTVSPTLGGEQLRAGIIAGVIGLILVLVYSAIYYRALSVIVLGSLASAALITYAVVVILGQTISFALSLPGIAGVIMAIGVTADSFIIYFERIRDEIREGYSLQHSVESGWVKARGTIVIADAVQLLSAIVLFILSVATVKGFAFTLFVTTAIDLFIVFFFSKPLMSLLARTAFYSSGHPMSGFDPAHLGVSPEALRGRRTVRAVRAATASKEA